MRWETIVFVRVLQMPLEFEEDNFNHYATKLWVGPGGFFDLGLEEEGPLPLDFCLTFTLKGERSTTRESPLLGAGLRREGAGGGAVKEVVTGARTETCSGLF